MSSDNGLTRREELLNVATKLFAARGYHDAAADTPTPSTYRLTRAFAGVSVRFTRARIVRHLAADHNGLTVRFEFPL